MRPFLGFASNTGITVADQRGSKGVEAMDRVGQQAQVDARLNAEQSAQLFANIVHELVRLGEIDLVQAQDAIAEFKRLRSTDVHDAKKVSYLKEEQATRKVRPGSPNRLQMLSLIHI